MVYGGWQLFRVKYSRQQSGTQSQFLSRAEHASQQRVPGSFVVHMPLCPHVFFHVAGLLHSRGRTVRCARALHALCTRCARAVRKVGHSPPPVCSFLGVGLPQGTIAIVYPCSINPPPSRVYVPLPTGTLRPVYGDTFSGCRPRGIIFCAHFSDPLLHSPWTLMSEIGCSTLAPKFLPHWWGLRPTD